MFAVYLWPACRCGQTNLWYILQNSLKINFFISDSTKTIRHSLYVSFIIRRFLYIFSPYIKCALKITSSFDL